MPGMTAANPLQSQLVSAKEVVMGTRKCQGPGTRETGSGLEAKAAASLGACPDRTGGQMFTWCSWSKLLQI